VRSISENNLPASKASSPAEGAGFMRRAANRLRICRDTLLPSFNTRGRYEYEDRFVKNGADLVQRRVASTLEALRRKGASVVPDAGRWACRCVAERLATEDTLLSEMALLEYLPRDERSAELCISAVDRAIDRQLPSLIAALLAYSNVSDVSIRPGPVMCRRNRKKVRTIVNAN
jgi:hypothetical protein